MVEQAILLVFFKYTQDICAALFRAVGTAVEKVSWGQIKAGLK